MADSPAVPPSGTQELFTNFGAEPKLELSSFRGRTVSRASHDSKRSLGRFRFFVHFLSQKRARSYCLGHAICCLST
jgi:hypothetical protein